MEFVVGFMLAVALLFLAGSYWASTDNAEGTGFILGVVSTTFLLAILFWLFELIVNH